MATILTEILDVVRLGLDSILDRPSFPDELWSSFIETVPQTYHGLGLRGQ